MTNNTSSSYGAAQGIMAKTALNELRASGHPLGRPLALCLMFEAAENQLVAASVFNLAIALDAALHIPTESLLAEIRIQWWADALASKTNQNVPLIARLQSQYQRHDNFFTQLQGIIGKWQAACHHKTRDSSEGWVAVWRSIAFHLGHMTALDQAALIGRELHNATLGQKCYGFAGNIDIKSFSCTFHPLVFRVSSKFLTSIFSIFDTILGAPTLAEFVNLILFLSFCSISE